MKQWQLTRFGAENLELIDAAIPQPGPHELLVRVSAVSLNYRDKMVIEGSYFSNSTMPLVPLSDAVGEVVATGSDVTRFQTGQRVLTHFFPNWLDGQVRPESASLCLGSPLPGVLSEYILIDENGAVAAPAYLNDEEASTLPIAALTAWWALFANKPLLPGQTVLVQGTGGVSLFALQIASAFGAQVIVTSSQDEKMEKVRELGAWETINYARSRDWDKQALELTGSRGVDHIVEVAGGDLKPSVNALARGGQISLIGVLNGLDLSFEIMPFMLKFASLVPVGVGHRRAFEEMNRALEQKQIRPVIDSVYPFADARAALAHLDRGPFGKVVIKLG